MSRASRWALALVLLLASSTASAQESDACATYDDPSAPCALADGDVLSPMITKPGGRNYFWFAVIQPETHAVIDLTDLPADYDLYLFSDQAEDPTEPIARSVSPDTTPEHIEMVLHDVGTYLIEVVDDPSVPYAADAPYSLSLSLKAPPSPAPPPPPAPIPTPAPAPPQPVVPAAPLVPTTVEVPNVAGRTRDAAAAILKEAGFGVAFADVNRFSAAGPGTVAAQSPAARTTAARGTTVSLGLATGRVEVLAVAGKSADEAVSLLSSQGLQARISRRGSEHVAAGLAITTNPGPGSLLLPGDRVEVLVSQGR